ncbi:Bacteriophage replication gene A protein (GPA) [Acinetobacter baumannii]|uniref:replication endonuclease n=1 Tax=Providencia stuartii TaxID=588 RepID=UPI000DE76C4A|nr:replication endonuclease [Providencia stuartii]MDQ5989801.1 replication endonuclease [Providencia stuartii]SST02789.1 Bacteriophage replication gene A protein (GPA) [Acinetobacter baumannii]
MSKVLDFTQQPLTYTADMVFPYPWNKPKENGYYKSDVERPLTREQVVQGQAILNDIEALPRVLRYRYQKHYENLVKEKGLRKAHDFLYFRFHEQIWPRLNAVSSRYEMSAKALLTLSTRLSVEVSQFNRLFDLSDKPVKKLAETIAAGFFDLYEKYCDTLTEHHNGDREIIYEDSTQTEIYGRLAELAKGLHISPLHYQAYCRVLKNRKRGKKKQNLDVRKVISAIQRLTNTDYWYRKLKAHRTQWLEALMIANMDVCQNRNPYASKQAIRAVQAQRLSNMQYLQGMDIEDVETGERFDLFDKVMASVSNPEIRRMELMAQMAGIERVAKERGDIGMFITMTCPSKYHPTKLRKRKKDVIAVLNSKWKNEAYTPKDGQQYLVKVWSRIRSAFNDNNINVYGVRVVEPHHDGTPHWHMLLFVDKASRAKAIEIMRKRALKEDGDEAGAHKYRFECKHMNRGGAVGYIAKYIAKNIDGYALDGEIDHETGKDLKSMAAAVTAWASTWRIPQFQFYKLPSKGAYRECRRLPRGVSIADQLGDVAERVRAAADGGDFFEYVMSQGGPCIRRKEETIRVAREVSDVNTYGEEVQKVVGIYNQLATGKPTLKTRERQYKIVKKNTDAAGDGLLKSAIGAPRSPVNNCRSRITSNLSDVQFYEPERCSGEVCNIEEYGFAFIETDAQNAAGSEISQGRQQRQVSRIELNEEESELRPEICSFMQKTGFDLQTETMANMFIKGMAIKDDDRIFRFDGRQVRVIESELAIKERIQAVKAKKEADIRRNRERCAAALARITRLRGKNAD